MGYLTSQSPKTVDKFYIDDVEIEIDYAPSSGTIQPTVRVDGALLFAYQPVACLYTEAVVASVRRKLEGLERTDVYADGHKVGFELKLKGQPYRGVPFMQAGEAALKQLGYAFRPVGVLGDRLEGIWLPAQEAVV